MSAQALIREAQASGVSLRMVCGKVKVSGPREAVMRLLDPLREQREALTGVLKAAQLGRMPVAQQITANLPDDWSVLDAAYQTHHFNCPTCIAAGRGIQYGLRCGTGAALWARYAVAQLPSVTPPKE